MFEQCLKKYISYISFLPPKKCYEVSRAAQRSELIAETLWDFSWMSRKEEHVCAYGGKEVNSLRTGPKHYNRENNPGSSHNYSPNICLTDWLRI